MSDVYNASGKAELMGMLADKDEDEQVNCFVYYTCDSVTVITEGGIVIRKHHTIYKHNKLPFFALVKFPNQRTLLGLSTCEMVADSINYHDQLINNYADNLALNIHQSWVLKTSSTMEQKDFRMFPGKVFQVRNLDELTRTPLQAPITPYNEIASIGATINQVLGNMDQVDEQSNKTATEVRVSAARANIKQQSYVTYNREEAVKPLLAMWFDLNQQFLTKEKVINLLGSKEAKGLKVENDKVDLGVSAKVIITGEAGLVDKTQQLENLSTFLQLMGAITQMPPEIDKGKIISFALANIDLPQDIYKEEEVVEEVPQEVPQEQVPQQNNEEAIMQEVTQAAAKYNMQPPQLIQSIAQKMNITTNQVIDGIEASGSLEAFLANAQGVQK